MSRSVYGDSLFLLSCIISLVLVLSIIPIFILLLRSAQNRDNIKQLIAQFNTKWRNGYEINPILNDGVNKLEEREPINLLIEAGTAAIKDFDRASLLVIQRGCVEHLKKLHLDRTSDESALHPIYFYERVVTMCRSMLHIAVKERNEIAGIIILNLYYDMEKFYLQHFEDFNLNNSPEFHYDGMSFTVSMEQSFIKALQNNEDVLAEEVIELCRNWFALYVKEHLVTINYDHKPELEETSQVDSDIWFIQATFEKIFLNAITYKKPFLFKHIAMFYRVIGGAIVGSKNTRATKVGLLQYHGTFNLKLFKKFIKLVDTEISSEIYPFGTYVTQELTYVKSHVPFQYELKAFDFLFSEGKLNAFVINSIKSTALHVIPHLKEEKSLRALFGSIIEKFDSTRGFITANSTDKQKEVYILLERYLGWIEEWLSEKSCTEIDELAMEIKSVLKKFDLKNDFSQELNAKGYFVTDHLGK